MIGLLPVRRIITTIAIIYAALVVIGISALHVFGTAPSALSSLRLVFAGGAILDVALVGMLYVFWKPIWKAFPSLNHLLFPDLNGEWSMTIHWSSNELSGVVEARAIIRQNLLRLSMEVASANSNSETLIAHPKKDPESGTPILVYVYRVVPRKIGANAGEPYEGAAMLRYATDGIPMLRGNYFTSRRTDGHFELVRAKTT